MIIRRFFLGCGVAKCTPKTSKDKNGLLSCIKRLLELPILKKYFYKKMNSKEDYIYWKGKIGI